MMFAQMGQIILEAVFGLIIFALLLRFWLQVLRAPFRNPLGMFVVALTDWAVMPVRRIIPSVRGYDTATLLLAWFAAVLLVMATFALRGFPFSAVPFNAQLLFLVLGALDLLRFSIYLLIMVMILQAVMSWTSPHSPLAPVLSTVTRPFLAPIRRILPPLGGVDLSPIVVLVFAQIALVPLAAVFNAVSMRI